MGRWFDKLRAAPTRVRGSSLFVGTLIAQCLNVAFMPILTRLYDPEAFGYLALIVSVVGLVAPVAALRLQSAMLLPHSSRHATAVLALALAFSAVGSVLSAVGSHLLAYFGYFGEFADLPGFSAWVGIIVFLTASFSATSQFVLRDREYRLVASRNILQAIGTGVSKLLLYLFPGGGLGLVMGHAVGRLVGIVPLAVQVRRMARRFDSLDLKYVLKEYWRFPLLFTPATFLNSVGLVAPTLFVGIWYSVEDAGQWSVANQILALPIVLIATAAGQIVEAELALRTRTSSGVLTRFYLKYTVVLSFAAVTLVVGVLVAAPTLVPLFVGPGWETATAIITSLVVMTAARLVAAPLAKVLSVLQKAKLNFVMDCVRVCLLAAALGVVIRMGFGIVGAAMLISTSMAITYVIIWLSGLWAVRCYDREKTIS